MTTASEKRRARADLEAADLQIAALEYAIGRRRLGPAPKIWRPGAELDFWLRGFVDTLENAADHGDEAVQMLEKLLAPIDDEPAPLALAVAGANYWIHSDLDLPERANERQLAEGLEVSPADMRWILNFLELLLNALDRVAPDLTEAVSAGLRRCAQILREDGQAFIMYTSDRSPAAKLATEGLA